MTPEPFDTVTRSGEEGVYVVLPEWSGFAPDEDVEIERVGDLLYIRRRGEAAPSVAL